MLVSKQIFSEEIMNGNTQSTLIKENISNGKGSIEMITNNNGKKEKIYKKLTPKDVEKILLYPSKTSTMKRLRRLLKRTKNRKIKI